MTRTSWPLQPAYFYWIDGLRGIAALAVVVFHYHHFYLADYSDRPSIPPVETFPWSSTLSALFDHGHFAVQLFWFISGFVFTHVYMGRFSTFGTFAVARIARLYPLHLATLLCVALIQILSLTYAGHWQIYGNNDLRHFILQLGFASNWTTLSHGLSFNGPIWSVSLEVVVYLLFFIMIKPLRRGGFWLAAACAILFFSVGTQQQSLIPYVSWRVFACAGFFFAGCALKYALGPLLRQVWASIGATLIIVAGAVFVEDATFRVLAASIILLLLLSHLEIRFPETGKRVVRLGDLSYAIYLVHVPIQMLVLLIADLLFAGDRGFAESPLTLPLHLVATIVVAGIVHDHFERPAGRWIRRFSDRLNRVSAARAENAD